MLIWGIVKNQNPKRVCGRPVTSRIAPTASRSVSSADPHSWYLPPSGGVSRRHPLSDQRPPEKSDIKPSALEFTLSRSYFHKAEKDWRDFREPAVPSGTGILRALAGANVTLPNWRWRRRSPNGLACSSGIWPAVVPAAIKRDIADHSTREDVCGSRATLLAIPSSAVCLRIDDFATSDQMGAREKSRPV